MEKENDEGRCPLRMMERLQVHQRRRGVERKMAMKEKGPEGGGLLNTEGQRFRTSEHEGGQCLSERMNSHLSEDRMRGTEKAKQL